VSGVGDGEFVDGVIKGSPKVVNNVPDHQAESEGNWLADDEANVVARAVWLELGNQYCRVSFLEPLNVSLERYQVMLSAEEFEDRRPLRQHFQRKRAIRIRQGAAN
jgi:hypothetical protein